jgi:hypothetical protein
VGTGQHTDYHLRCVLILCQRIDLILCHHDDLADIHVSRCSSEGKGKRISVGELEEYLQDMSEGELGLLVGKHIFLKLTLLPPYLLLE